MESDSLETQATKAWKLLAFVAGGTQVPVIFMFAGTTAESVETISIFAFLFFSVFRPFLRFRLTGLDSRTGGVVMARETFFLFGLGILLWGVILFLFIIVPYQTFVPARYATWIGPILLALFFMALACISRELENLTERMVIKFKT